MGGRVPVQCDSGSTIEVVEHEPVEFDSPSPSTNDEARSHR